MEVQRVKLCKLMLVEWVRGLSLTGLIIPMLIWGLRLETLWVMLQSLLYLYG